MVVTTTRSSRLNPSDDPGSSRTEVDVHSSDTLRRTGRRCHRGKCPDPYAPSPRTQPAELRCATSAASSGTRQRLGRGGPRERAAQSGERSGRTRPRLREPPGGVPAAAGEPSTGSAFPGTLPCHQPLRRGQRLTQARSSLISRGRSSSSRSDPGPDAAASTEAPPGDLHRIRAAHARVVAAARGSGKRPPERTSGSSAPPCRHHLR